MIDRTSDRRRIAQLSPHLVNQIAAGEVIERPASVVKELCENAIDAGATRIAVELEQGGSRRISVTDDGIGIVPDDLELAVASHATSKIREESELHAIGTLGFRGEALASIASVSELEIASRPRDLDAAERIVAKEGRIERIAPEALEPGTRMSVRHLFYNVPARKRFLKSERAELTRVKQLLSKLALATPSIAWSLVHDGRSVFRWNAQRHEVDRVADVLGEETRARLLEVDSGDGRLTGWIGRPDFFKRTRESIHVFLNGRTIQDGVIISALREAYRGFQIPGRYAVAVLRLELDPSEFDVNVHPTKQEVRFRESGSVYRLLFSTARDRLLATGSVPNLLGDRDRSRETPNREREWPPARRETPTDFLENARPASGEVPVEDYDRRIETRTSAWRGDVLADEPASVTDDARESSEHVPRNDFGSATPAPGEAETLDLDDAVSRVFQVHNSYLVVEERGGLTIIDQHALHEKILYEEILERRERGELRQPLLVPEAVALDASDWEAFEQVREPLEKLGFEVEEFGDDRVLVRAIPAGFDRRSIESLLRSALSQLRIALESGGATRVELHDRLLETLACKRAVKAGQRLSRDEQIELVRGRARAFQPQNCPHGRPSELFLSWEELDRRFDRK